MSSQIVISPLLVPAAAGSAVIGVCAYAGYFACSAVKTLVDHRVAAALRRAEEEKVHLEEWRRFQAEQKRVVEEMREVQAAIRTAEKSFGSVRIARAAEAPSLGRRARGYSSAGEPVFPSSANAMAILDELSKIILSMPRSFSEGAKSPCPKLERQKSRLSARLGGANPPAMEEVVAFKRAAERSISSYARTQKATSHKTQEMLVTVEALLFDLLFARELARSTKVASELGSLQNQVLVFLSSDEIKPGQVDFFRSRIAELKQSVEAENARSSYRAALGESLTRNLGEMGYSTLKGFERIDEGDLSEALIAVPGGEYLRVSIAPDDQVCFELVHEDKEGSGSVEEVDLLFFRHQESMWCKDFTECMRRMIREGFEFQVKLEREIPQESIRVVVVETAEEIQSQVDQGEEEALSFEERPIERRRG